MTAVDNHELLAQFMPAEDDGDTFLYTELVNRGVKDGSNRMRIVRVFYHRSRAQFLEQWPSIATACINLNVRAYTRLAPRSYKAVGKLFTRLVVEASLAGAWKDMSRLYASACGRATPLEKRWLFDVDEPTEDTARFSNWLAENFLLAAVVPSRKGYHLICQPFDIRRNSFASILPGVSLHKDNPTNLYIPAGAACPTRSRSTKHWRGAPTGTE